MLGPLVLLPRAIPALTSTYRDVTVAVPFSDRWGIRTVGPQGEKGEEYASHTSTVEGRHEHRSGPRAHRHRRPSPSGSAARWTSMPCHLPPRPQRFRVRSYRADSMMKAMTERHDEFWNQRLADDWSESGVGYRALGRPFNNWMYRVRRHVFTHGAAARSEEHTSELQSRGHLVCRLL